MDCAELKDLIEAAWPGRARCRFDAAGRVNEVACERALLADLCRRLFHDYGFGFAGLIVEEGTPQQIFTAPQQDRTKLFLSQILHH